MATPTQNAAANDKRESLRHALATLAYRGGKVVRGVPAEFADFCSGAECRTPLQEAKRFFAGMKALDASLLSPSSQPPRFEELLFQGPIADALTHVGQIAILRRLAGCPVKGENYYQAEIVAGRVGPEQAAPKREF